MLTDVVKVEHLTKDYGSDMGVFDISFSLAKGGVMGFLGPNGAGKTTTIRYLMGFIRPQGGATTVMGINSWYQAHDIQHYLGCLPGEIAFPGSMTEERYLRTLAKLRHMDNFQKACQLLDEFEI